MTGDSSLWYVGVNRTNLLWKYRLDHMQSEIIPHLISLLTHNMSRSQWPRGLRRRSAAARLLRLWVRIPPEAWMFVCCECFVLSGRGLCDELIIRLEKSYWLWCVTVCDLETSWMRRPWPTGGCRAKNKQTNKQTNKWTHNMKTANDSLRDSSRGVLPPVMRRCVWSRNLVNKEAMARCGLSHQKQTNSQYEYGKLFTPRRSKRNKVFFTLQTLYGFMLQACIQFNLPVRKAWFFPASIFTKLINSR